MSGRVVREMVLRWKDHADDVAEFPANAIISSATVRETFAFLTDRVEEEVWALFVNGANEPLARFQVGKGGLSESSCNMGSVYRAALVNAAAAVILIHNHPSGKAFPSAGDRKVTEEGVKAGVLLGIPLLDHVIVAARGSYSFADHGLLSEYRSRALKEAEP